MRPYSDLYEENAVIRTFEESVDSGELHWHRDREDRWVYPVNETDWGIQIDNELPRKLKGEVFIPKGVWHRVIKGSGYLKIRIVSQRILGI
jgi:hypothetical protein